MKIISCYVENFGKLNEFKYDFQDGLNVIEEENGWGKSTLSAFIKAMFYGLEYHRGKKLTDRKLYSPWNENKFGGYLIFSQDGIEYKIERFFGTTAKFDTMTVYNMSKNTVTEEFGNNPGEKIWKVDRDSYEKTAFITLDDSSLLNDIISSKLGNIEEQEADVEASTQAVDLLDKEITRIKSKRGKGGLIGDKESSLNTMKTELRQYKNSLIKFSETEKLIIKEEEELKEITTKINKIEEKQSKSILYDRKLQYKNISDDFIYKEKDYNQKKSFFKERILSEKELNNIKTEAGRYINTKEQSNKIKLSDLEEIEFENLKGKFDKDTPSLVEIENYNQKINELSNRKIEIKKHLTSEQDKKKLAELENKYKYIDINTIDQYLEDLNDVAGLIKEENDIKHKIESLKQQKVINPETKSKINPNRFKYLGIIVLGIISTPILSIFGIIIALIGVFMLVKSFVDKSKHQDEYIKSDNDLEIKALITKLEEVEKKRGKLEEGYLSFIESINENPSNITALLANIKVYISEYDRLRVEIEQNESIKNTLENEILNLEEEISLYLNRYYDFVEKNDYGKLLSNLRNEFNTYQNLLKSEKLYNESIEEVASLRKNINKKLLYYYEELDSDIREMIQDLTNKYYDLEKAKDKFKEAEQNKNRFELENNVALLDELDFEDIEDQKAIENLRENKTNLNEHSKNLIKEIERYKKDIDTLIQEVDKIEDIESEIFKTEEEIKNLNDQHNLLTLTKECMIEAIENLAEKYMGDMSSSFKRNLEKLNSGEANKYHIDINLSIKVEHGGKLYDKEQLSSGMKDLVQLCLRMSLVESVYKDVYNPILILDDPFINLDNVRLGNSMELLNEISSEYQIIYFICHSSRNTK